jgi:hypothetical protein
MHVQGNYKRPTWHLLSATLKLLVLQILRSIRRIRIRRSITVGTNFVLG